MALRRGDKKNKEDPGAEDPRTRMDGKQVGLSASGSSLGAATPVPGSQTAQLCHPPGLALPWTSTCGPEGSVL